MNKIPHFSKEKATGRIEIWIDFFTLAQKQTERYKENWAGPHQTCENPRWPLGCLKPCTAWFLLCLPTADWPVIFFPSQPTEAGTTSSPTRTAAYIHSPEWMQPAPTSERTPQGLMSAMPGEGIKDGAKGHRKIKWGTRSSVKLDLHTAKKSCLFSRCKQHHFI